MTLRDRILTTEIQLTGSEAARLRAPAGDEVIEVRPPHGDLPGSLPRFVNGIREYQTKWFKLRNTSPTVCYEIRRVNGRLSLQYAVPSARQARKVYAHLEEDIPDIEFSTGEGGLPVDEGTTIGGAVLRPHYADWYPLRTEFNRPPTNAVVSALDQSSMQGTDFVLQVAFKPNAGRSLKRWLWQKRAGREQSYLRDEKVGFGGERSATRREKRKSRSVDLKRDIPGFTATIAHLVFDAGAYTRSRVKEVSGSFNTFRSPETGQAFDTVPVRHLRRGIFLEFADAIRRHRLAPWATPFQASIDEVAALVAVPDRDQENLRRAKA